MRQKVPGRKRGLAVDVLGLVIAVVVLAASVHDNATGIALLDKVAADTVQKALVDQGFKNAVVAHGQKVGIEVAIVERNPAQTAFVPIPKRWIVERAYGILMRPNPGRPNAWSPSVAVSMIVPSPTGCRASSCFGARFLRLSECRALSPAGGVRRGRG